MKRIFTSFVLVAISATAMAQQLPNGGFENWGNTSPGNVDEPTGYYSNKTGSSTAQLGPQTCFKDNAIFHGGAASVRIESKTVPVINTVVNGNLTTGVINAPTTSKADGYIGTVNYSTASDVRRTAFTGRPDSLVGWYQYTQGGAAEQGKVKVILHTGNYYDPEAATTYHPDASANRIGMAQFITPAANVATWTRFSVPFTYAAATNPAYVMLNATSSNDQLTTVAGSKLWLDDVALVYNAPSNVNTVTTLDKNVRVYCNGRMLYTDFLVRSNERYNLQLIDITGRQVATQLVIANGLNTLDISALNAGIYSYRLVGNSGYMAGRVSVQ